MAESFLKPTKVPTPKRGQRDMDEGQFRNPPLYTELGGFSSASKAKFDNKRMTLERGGPTSKKGRPI